MLISKKYNNIKIFARLSIDKAGKLPLLIFI